MPDLYYSLSQDAENLYLNDHSQTISPCLQTFPHVPENFLYGKSKNQIPCFPYAVANLICLPHTE